MLNLHKIWAEQCEAGRGIENEFGTVPAMKYLVGDWCNDDAEPLRILPVDA